MALVTALMLTYGSAAHAHYNTQIYSLDSFPTCTGINCPWGTVTVSQDPSSHQQIDFTVNLNSAYSFNSSGSSTEPLFAFNVISTLVSPAVTLGNFKINNVAEPNVQAGTVNQSVPGFGTFAYTLKSTFATGTTFAGPLTFTASVGSGTLTPDNIAITTTSGHKPYMIADVLQGIGVSSVVAAVNVPTPEPAGLGLFAVALAGLGIVRSRWPRR
jgi:hypothetical protein